MGGPTPGVGSSASSAGLIAIVKEIVSLFQSVGG